MPQSIISLEDVWKIYRMGEVEVQALRGLTLDIKKGEFVAIMGPSGSGKSTAVNMVGCLDVPTRGKVFLEDHDISKLSESDLAQIRGRKIGFIFQQFNLIPNLTAKENVMLPMLFQNIDKEERSGRAKELLEMVELKDRMDHYPNQLSGGQQQRVAIARSLANNPEVILADEPTGNLDSKTEIKIMEFLTNLNKRGKTVVIVTHSPEIAEEYANTIYWIKDGKIEKITKRSGKKWKTVSKMS